MPSPSVDLPSFCSVALWSTGGARPSEPYTVKTTKKVFKSKSFLNNSATFVLGVAYYRLIHFISYFPLHMWDIIKYPAGLTYNLSLSFVLPVITRPQKIRSTYGSCERVWL